MYLEGTKAEREDHIKSGIEELNGFFFFLEDKTKNKE